MVAPKGNPQSHVSWTGVLFLADKDFFENR